MRLLRKDRILEQPAEELTTLFLLYPEWQGSGTAPVVHAGALRIANDLLHSVALTTIDSPSEEHLDRTDGVVGLRSIAPRFREALARLRALAPSRIVTIGGTCGVEAAPVGYLNERYGQDLAVVWFDAHGDLNTPESSPSGNFHGMILRTLLGEGPSEYTRELRRPLAPAQVFLAGTRDLDPAEKEYVATANISVTPPEEFGEPARLVERIRTRGFRRVYLHLDLDVLNPEEFGDTLICTPGGPTVAQLRAAMEALTAAFDIAGFSMVEYVPGTSQSMDVLRQLASTVLRARFPGRCE